MAGDNFSPYRCPIRDLWSLASDNTALRVEGEKGESDGLQAI